MSRCQRPDLRHHRHLPGTPVRSRTAAGRNSPVLLLSGDHEFESAGTTTFGITVFDSRWCWFAVFAVPAAPGGWYVPPSILLAQPPGADERPTGMGHARPYLARI